MGQKERRLRERELRREDIIDAAERVFSSKGYESASMDEISKEAEYSKRTVYLYFSSKEQLYFEIMIRGYRLLSASIEMSLAERRPENAMEELRCIFDAYFQFTKQHPAYFRAIMEYETEDSEDRAAVEDESKAECYRLGERMFGYLSHALQKGASEGTLRAAVAGDKAALMLWACAVGIFNVFEKKGSYLRQYHGVEPAEFVTASFETMISLLCSGGGDGYEKNGI